MLLSEYDDGVYAGNKIPGLTYSSILPFPAHPTSWWDTQKHVPKSIEVFAFESETQGMCPFICDWAFTT